MSTAGPGGGFTAGPCLREASLKHPGPDGTAGRTAVSQGSPRRACLVPFEHLTKDTDLGGAHPALGKGHAVQTSAFCSVTVSSAPRSPSSPETRRAGSPPGRTTSPQGHSLSSGSKARRSADTPPTFTGRSPRCPAFWAPR